MLWLQETDMRIAEPLETQYVEFTTEILENTYPFLLVG